MVPLGLRSKTMQLAKPSGSQSFGLFFAILASLRSMAGGVSRLPKTAQIKAWKAGKRTEQTNPLYHFLMLTLKELQFDLAGLSLVMR